MPISLNPVKQALDFNKYIPWFEAEQKLRAKKDVFHDINLKFASQLRTSSGALADCRLEGLDSDQRHAISLLGFVVRRNIAMYVADKQLNYVVKIRAEAVCANSMYLFSPYGSALTGRFEISDPIRAVDTFEQNFIGQPIYVSAASLKSSVRSSMGDLVRASEKIIERAKAKGAILKKAEFIEEIINQEPAATVRSVEELWKKCAPEDWHKPGRRPVSSP